MYRQLVKDGNNNNKKKKKKRSVLIGFDRTLSW